MGYLDIVESVEHMDDPGTTNRQAAPPHFPAQLGFGCYLFVPDWVNLTLSRSR